ncbi:hypothetical protein FNV43_RR09229 [Rhamnella rubrinervis]|uniref:Uncharacterized protein n=1 Tax=Rhamnella rubrinervis TaxID=2594499 RepID=A0A8K0H9M8_9ROSA|nr:hypothetical protein FNV43_RR09229 [Rhamnella rubrinervis]
MGDLLGSLTKSHTVGHAVAKLGQYRLERDQRSPVESVRPDRGTPVWGVTGGIRACTQPEVCRRGRWAPKGVDCDDLSGRVREAPSVGVLQGSLTKPHTVGCAVAKLRTISVGKGPKEPGKR